MIGRESVHQISLFSFTKKKKSFSCLIRQKQKSSPQQVGSLGRQRQKISQCTSTVGGAPR